ncbi:methylated-DNA--protein-cysteine methyltransferase [Spirochaetota bacterium]|nr:methylated-DNA--protein-cysteine methyltransferase [Spirochaetota bacterium]
MRKLIYDVFTPPPSVPLKDLNLYALENGAIIAIEFSPTQSRRSHDLKKLFSVSEIVNGDLTTVKQELREYFLNKRQQFTIPMQLYGTPFQVRVWEALLKIPYGKVVSYKDIAIEAANSKGAKPIHSLTSRAVGTAVGTNPISIVIPCHRVLKLAGNSNASTSPRTQIEYRVGKYGGGIATKKWLLALESADDANLILGM